MTQPIQGLDYWMHKTIPQVYTDAMSYSELLQGVLGKLDEVIKASNEYFGQDMSVVIEGKLGKWLTDGTLAGIINGAVFGEINTSIDGIKSDMLEINGITQQAVDLYVSDSIGNDTTGNGSITKPYKTIQECMNKIPKVINKDRFINIAPGSYNEDVLCKSVTGAGLIIQKWGEQPTGVPVTTTGVKVRSFVFFDVSGYIRITGMESYNASSIASGKFIRFSRCSYGSVGMCRMADTAISGTSIEWDGSGGSVNSCYFNGQEICVHSLNGSKIRVDSTSEHGSSPSATGILVEAADAFFNGQPTWADKCSNPRAIDKGGKFNYTFETIDLTLFNGWKPYDLANYKPRAMKVNSMVCLQGIIKEGTVGQGVIAIQLPPGYRPQLNNRIHGVFSSDGTIAKILVDQDGGLAVEVASGQYVSLADIPPFYGGE